MKVFVKTPARLHLGLIDLGGELGRLYGGMGVAINYPNVVVEAENSQSLTIEGQNSEPLRRSLELFIKKYSIEPKVSIKIKQVIPQHVGLGSGTQLALATATALAKLFNINASAEELAKTMGRGKVSGVGTAIFAKGGFVVESGIKPQESNSEVSMPPLIFHQPFPPDWFFVVAIPNVKHGLSGKEEANAFRSLPPMSSEKAARISHLIVMSLLPALKEKDMKTFGSSLTQIQNIVGDCFASVQGGRFSSSPSNQCIQYMLKNGAFGAGQSSWGPTVYGLVEGEEAARKLCSQVKSFLQKSTDGQVFYTTTNNRGAFIKTTQGVSKREV